MSSNKEKIQTITNKKSDEDDDVRRGPWTVEEDNLLISYINSHGEGRWNSLAKFAGLKRTGKSCRLRWLNYLNPDIKRGNLSPHEQILILELHSKWGNRWSKIAQHLPGRTDNEIKNYWRTRVQKQARQLKVDSNSKKFLDTVRMFWLPRLIQKMEQNISSETSSSSPSSASSISTVETSQRKLNPSTLANNKVSINGDESLDCNNNKPQAVRSDEVPEIPRSLKNNPSIAGKSMGDDDDCYYVGFPSYDDDDVRGLEEYSYMDANEPLSGRHVEGYDWPVEGLTGSSFCNTDELWLGVI